MSFHNNIICSWSIPWLIMAMCLHVAHKFWVPCDRQNKNAAKFKSCALIGTSFIWFSGVPSTCPLEVVSRCFPRRRIVKCIERALLLSPVNNSANRPFNSKLLMASLSPANLRITRIKLPNLNRKISPPVLGFSNGKLLNLPLRYQVLKTKL